ncbi:MAG: hypothetical protein QOH85_47 [Acidobacteriaceae bacterium]|nr:hypothetical protein [Acidobacteriaceae bacterium]
MVFRDSLLGAYVAEHRQLLLVISTEIFFLPFCAAESIGICSNLVANLLGALRQRIVRMQKLFLSIGVVLIVLLSSFAQNVEPVSASADVVLKLGTEGDGHQFHLGELIPVKFSYSAKTPGRYVWVSQSRKLAGGRSLEISCSPSAERVSLNPRSVDDVTFGQMLDAPCGGVGGGGGGGCGDCDRDYLLTATALTFGVVPLNTYVRFRTPGTYTCEASSADITTTPRDEKIRPALLVKSNPVLLTILDDPGWAHSAALACAGVYEKLCRGDDVAEHRFLQCSEVARRITYLDTADLLSTEVKWFDGRNHGWDNGFWDAIQHSSNPEEALRLIAARMQEPDFEVSSGVLEWLASSELRVEVPDAFQSGTPATYHAQAVEKLRKYVQLLGGSLSQKDSNVLSESVKTYRTFADQRYCEPQSLIPREEQNQVLTSLGTRP